MRYQKHHFNDIILFLNILDNKIKSYNCEINKLLKKINIQQSKLKLYFRINNNIKNNIKNNTKILEKQELELLKIKNLTCNICFENISQIILQPCLHFCCCENCFENILDNKCPICRSEFFNHLKVFI